MCLGLSSSIALCWINDEDESDVQKDENSRFYCVFAFLLLFSGKKCLSMLKGWFPVSSDFYVRTCVKFTLTSQIKQRYYTWKVACENSRFSSFFAAGYVSRGGTSATQWQKFHTDDVIQCLHNIYRSHGVPYPNLFNFTFLLVDFTKVLCSSANELQQNSNASSKEV